MERGQSQLQTHPRFPLGDSERLSDRTGQNPGGRGPVRQRRTRGVPPGRPPEPPRPAARHRRSAVQGRRHQDRCTGSLGWCLFGSNAVIHPFFHFPGHALDFLLGNSLTEEAGARKDFPKVLVVVTDGRSEDAVEDSARKLRSAGVEVFVLGACSHLCPTFTWSQTSVTSSAEDKRDGRLSGASGLAWCHQRCVHFRGRTG